MIPAPSARLRRCRQSTGVGASCPATNKNRRNCCRYMTYEATRGYYTSRLLTACNLLASNMIVTHSKVRNRLLQNAVAILWVKVLILLMVASYKEKVTCIYLLFLYFALQI
ncbi:hypothetical protein CFC21_070683 [Triticum aestivum]|uniref:Uncharacterized protein n=2 Tax=Triticum aestivum TaxID=4565 RepID=A0A9R1KS51_WHEAT|nr:hypothetical protein CFC21_070683 [Triticum aestivum]